METAKTTKPRRDDPCPDHSDRGLSLACYSHQIPPSNGFTHDALAEPARMRARPRIAKREVEATGEARGSSRRPRATPLAGRYDAPRCAELFFQPRPPRSSSP
jgi:hypothetical protein